MKEKQPEGFAITDGGNIMLTDMMATTSRIFDRCPHEVAVIYKAVHREMQSKKVPRSTKWNQLASPEWDAFIAESFQEIYPKVGSLPHVKSALGRILAEYAVMPSTAATRLKASRSDNSITGAVFVGLALGTLINGTIIVYLAVSDMAGSD